MYRQWEETTKGEIAKEFFPSVERSLAVSLDLSPNVTTVMTGNGNIRFYEFNFCVSMHHHIWAVLGPA
jgi:hypothetical protein